MKYSGSGKAIRDPNDKSNVAKAKDLLQVVGTDPHHVKKLLVKHGLEAAKYNNVKGHVPQILPRHGSVSKKYDTQFQNL